MPSLLHTRPVEVQPPFPGAPRPPTSADAAAWNRFFEELYQSADHDPRRVPWADGRPNPALVAWLNAEAPGLLRPGSTVAVVGCGLGDDAAELEARGYDVLGFDVSARAVEWARELHPTLSERLIVADLFQLPTRLLRRFDLVVEIYTLQSIHPDLRPAAAAAVCSLARPRGAVLAICRGRDESEPMDGPPFPLTARELTELMQAQGLSPAHAIDSFTDDQDPPRRRLRGLFRRL